MYDATLVIPEVCNIDTEDKLDNIRPIRCLLILTNLGKSKEIGF